MPTFTIVFSSDAATAATRSLLTDIASGTLTVIDTVASFTGAMDRATANSIVEALGAAGIPASVEASVEASAEAEASAFAHLAIAVSAVSGADDIVAASPMVDIVITAHDYEGDVLTPIAVQGLVEYNEPPSAVDGADFVIYARTAQLGDVKAALKVATIPCKVTVRKS